MPFLISPSLHLYSYTAQLCQDQTFVLLLLVVQFRGDGLTISVPSDNSRSRRRLISRRLSSPKIFISFSWFAVKVITQCVLACVRALVDANWFMRYVCGTSARNIDFVTQELVITGPQQLVIR